VAADILSSHLCSYLTLTAFPVGCEEDEMWRTASRYVAVTLALSWTVGAANMTVVGVSTGIDPKTLQRPARRNINDLYAEGGAEW